MVVISFLFSWPTAVSLGKLQLISVSIGQQLANQSDFDRGVQTKGSL